MLKGLEGAPLDDAPLASWGQECANASEDYQEVIRALEEHRAPASRDAESGSACLFLEVLQEAVLDVSVLDQELRAVPVVGVALHPPVLEVRGRNASETHGALRGRHGRSADQMRSLEAISMTCDAAPAPASR